MEPERVPLTPEERADLCYESDIIIKRKLPYFEGQVEGTYYRVIDVLKSEGTMVKAEYDAKLADAQLAHSESKINLDSAKTRLDIIHRDLRNNTLTTVNSTAGIKRGRGLDDSDVQASSSKRK